MFFALRPSRATLSDLNRPLVETFRAVQRYPRRLISFLRRLSPPRNEEEYYEARTRFNTLVRRLPRSSEEVSISVAALFIWLNHTCYNGLFRMNKGGGFNVPFGYYVNPQIFSERHLLAAAQVLKDAKAKIVCEDYETALAPAKEGDVVYLDPPYDPDTPSSGFVDYTSVGFGENEQSRLAAVVRDLVKRKCRVILSNSPSERVLKLYEGFTTQRVRVPRAINSIGKGRARVEELIITA